MTSANEVSERTGLRVGLVARLLKPRSVAIVGFSQRPDSAGQAVLANLEGNNFPGDIHLVGRTPGLAGERPILGSLADLPPGVDLAVLAVPADAVQASIDGLVAREAGCAVVFASGFAETGEDARGLQNALGASAQRGGLGLVGPNCLGYTNYVDGIDLGFIPQPPLRPLSKVGPAPIAIVAQSGGLMGLISQALTARGIPTAYRISTGNEADLGLSDYLAFMAGEPNVGTIVVYAEHVRRPQEFLAAVRMAKAAGKTVVMLHTGRGAKAQSAAASHTGAVAGDYKVMATQVAHAGVLLVESVEELLDCAELATRFPNAPVAGPAVATTSGAFCAIAHDTCEELGFDLPQLSASSLSVLTPRLPDFTPPNNPLDLTTQVVWDVDLTADAIQVLHDDPAVGSVTVAVPVGSGEWFAPVARLIPKLTKPVQVALFVDGAPIPPAIEQLAREAGLILSRSPERALRAMARFTEHGRRHRAGPAASDAAAAALPGLPGFRAGTQAEWVGKDVLRSLGIRVPEGSLATSVDDAVSIANNIGYPVVLKVQASELAHKTEMGGVLLNLATADAVRTAYAELERRAAAFRPDVVLDGILVEAMSAKGIELIVGAKRDPAWGPVVIVGSGGVMVEALADVRLLPAGTDRAAVEAELGKLKLAKLLGPFRGGPARDLAAVAATVETVGRLMAAREDIVEIDINPLVALPSGEGVIALDALIITSSN